MRRRKQTAFANPVLIGAVTVLVVMVAVFLAYNANKGLPFVPTRAAEGRLRRRRRISSSATTCARAASGSASSPTMKPIELPNGQVGAQLTLKLEQVERATIPVDSTAIDPSRGRCSA